MHSPHLSGAPPIPVEVLLAGYRGGIFPMADDREDDEVFWVEPRERAVIPLDGFRCSRSLAKALRQDRFRVTLDADFAGVMEACAAPRPGHPRTWISHRIAASYLALHRAGHAHSIECWLDGPAGSELVGGLYGVGFERAFCGESMFSRRDDASKVALAWLVALLRKARFRLLDCQFMTDHLASLGAVEIDRADYRALLAEAVAEGLADGLGEGDGAGDLAAAFAALLAEADGLASSPGKLIAHFLTHTS